MPSLSATCFGVRIGVSVNDAAWLPAIEEHLPPAWTPSDLSRLDFQYAMHRGGPIPGTRIRRFHFGFAGSTQIVKTLHDRVALEALETAVFADVSVAADPWVFVHAGVVAIDGRAVVIPGASTSGKTSLVKALIEAGATYLSDESAVIDEHGRVHPFPRRLSVRGASPETIRMTAAELGAGTGSEPLPLGLVISTRYEPEAEWQPRPGTRGEAVMAMYANTIKARIAPAAVLSTLARAVEHAVMIQGVRGEATAAARRIFQIVADGTAATTTTR